MLAGAEMSTFKFLSPSPGEEASERSSEPATCACAHVTHHLWIPGRRQMLPAGRPAVGQGEGPVSGAPHIPGIQPGQRCFW